MRTENSIHRMLGVNPIIDRVQDDFYSTDPEAIDWLLKYEDFNNTIWECACGNGNLVNRLREHGYNVIATDLVDRGCPDSSTLNFLTLTGDLDSCTEQQREREREFKCDIITNPPYSLVTEFVQQAYKLTNRKVAMFLKIQFLETIRRYEEIFKTIPPKVIYIFVKRIPCYRNDIRKYKGSAVCYTWVVWDKEYTGDTIIRWIPNHK